MKLEPEIDEDAWHEFVACTVLYNAFNFGVKDAKSGKTVPPYEFMGNGVAEVILREAWTNGFNSTNPYTLKPYHDT